MNNLQLKVQEIDTLLSWISDTLGTITEENFDHKMEDLNKNIQKYLSLKNDLRISLSEPQFDSYEISRAEFTKQIKQKFDNIITRIQTEKDLVKSELANFQNQKKLTNYNR